MKVFLSRFLKNHKSGMTAVEYGLIGALIWVATMVGFRSFMNKLSNTFNMFR